MKHLLKTIVPAAAFCLAALLLLPAAAAESPLASAARATRKNHPDADAVVLRDFSRSTYQPDGTGTDVGELYVKILTERGRREFRTLELPFRDGFTTAEVEVIEVIGADGRIRKVDPAANSRVVTDNSMNASNIYSPEDKMLTVAVPQLAIGEILHWRVRYTTVKPRIPGHWSCSYSLQDRYPVYEAEVEIDAPASRPLLTAKVLNPTGGKIEHSRKSAGGRIIRRWSVRDVPMIVTEPNMPPLGAVVQRLVANTAGSWNDVSRWFYAIQEKHLAAVNPAMKETVAELIRGAKTPEEKIDAIFRFVTRRIRYLGITNEDYSPGMEPHDVSLTFDRRHGVCRDKAALLVAMLRLAGFEAWPVGFLMRDLRLDPLTPEWRFDHEIAAVRKPDGSFLLMDPTNAGGKAMLPEWMNNRNYLLFTPDGGKLGITGVPDASANTLKIVTEAELGIDGTLSGSTRMLFLGVNDGYRRAFLENPEHLRTEYFGRQLKSVLPGAELVHLEILPADLRDLSRPLEVRLGFRLISALPASSETAALPLPEFGRRMGFIHRLLSRLDLEKRRYNCKFPITAAVDESCSIRLPKNRRLLSFPDEERLGDAKTLSWERGFKFADGVLSFRRKIALHTVEATPDEYAKMRTILAAVGRRDRAAPLVELEYETLSVPQMADFFPDSPYFSVFEKRRITLGDDGRSWEDRLDFERLVLNRNGVSNASELRFAFHPANESVTVNAEVIRPDGTTLALSPKELNLLDDEAFAAAPRYPAGKVLIAALPGVEPGSKIRGTVIRKVRDRSFFSHTEFFADFSPAVRREFTLVAPHSLELRIGEAPNHVRMKTRREERGPVVRHWSAEETSPVPLESNQPPPELFLPQLNLSYRGYKEYSARLSAILTERLADDAPEVRKTVARLSEKLPVTPRRAADLAFIAAIRDFTAVNIRAAGPALNAMPPEFLSKPDVTLKSGYGNSADRALLLAAMLRCRDIRFRFVAVSDLPFVPETAKRFKNVPADIFDELLVYLPEYNLYLNDTDQYAALGAVAHENALALDLEDVRLTAVMPSTGCSSKTRITNTIRISSDGSASIRRRHEVSGAAGAELRKELSERTEEERRRFVEELSGRIAPGARIDGAVRFHFDRTPFAIEWSLKVDGFAFRGGDRFAFTLPGSGEFAEAIRCAEDSRRTPFWRPKALKVSRKYEITLPAGYRTPRRERQRDWGRFGSALYREHSDFTHEQLLIDGKMTLPPEVVQPADYPELIRLQRQLGKPSTTMIVLQRRSREPLGGSRPAPATKGESNQK